MKCTRWTIVARPLTFRHGNLCVVDRAAELFGQPSPQHGRDLDRAACIRHWGEHHTTRASFADCGSTVTAMPVQQKINAGIHLVRSLLHPRRVLDDEYLTWLGYANAGMQDVGNPYLMDLAIQQLVSSSPVVEIGSFCGLSTNMLSHLLAKHGRTNPLVGADPWQFEHGEGNDSIGDGVKLEEYTEFVRESFRRNVAFFSRNRPPHIFPMTSDDFFGAWARGDEGVDTEGVRVSLGGPISFAFIDGNHTYDFARRDFEGVDRDLETGGFILFDDSADASGFEVNRLMKEIAATPRYELVMKNPNYLFRRTSES